MTTTPELVAFHRCGTITPFIGYIYAPENWCLLMLYHQDNTKVSHDENRVGCGPLIESSVSNLRRKGQNSISA